MTQRQRFFCSDKEYNQVLLQTRALFCCAPKHDIAMLLEVDR